jgi:transcriptional regulator with XRE-family HTH domain
MLSADARDDGHNARMRPISASERQLRQQLGARLAIALDFAGITQQELADQLQAQRPKRASRLTQGYIAQLITGQRNIAPELVRQAAKITKVPLTYLVNGTGWEAPPSSIRLGHRPKSSTPIPLDAQGISVIRLHGQAGYWLSAQTTKTLTDHLNRELDKTKQISANDDILVIVLRGARKKPKKQKTKTS